MNSSYLIQSVSECAAVFATEENPQNWQASCRDLGNLLQGMGRFEEAITWHSLALESEPNLAEIYAQLGRLYAEGKNWPEAIAFFENALKSIPNSVHIYSNLAQIYSQMGERDLETSCWYKAVGLNPDLINAQGYYKLGQALEEQGKIDEAIECYQHSCDREPSLLAAHYKLAEKRLHQSDLESARTCLENIIKEDFNQSQAHYQLGRILSRLGKLDLAAEEFRHTIKIDPEFNWAYSSLVNTFMQQKKWDEAISTCHAIMNLVEEFPWVYSLLGNALRAKGRINDAVAAYQKSYATRGWTECVENNYFFPVDQFTHRLALFEEHLLPLANQENLAFLQLGNYFGMSACWLLDKVLTHTSDSLTCIDQKFDRKLEDNLTKTGSKEKVQLVEGDIVQNLAALKPESFDVAIIQDQQKHWKLVNKNATLVWDTVKINGIIVFGSYGWRNAKNLEKDPKKGIDLFLESIKGQWEIVAHPPRGFQIAIRKITKSKQ